MNKRELATENAQLREQLAKAKADVVKESDARDGDGEVNAKKVADALREAQAAKAAAETEQLRAHNSREEARLLRRQVDHQRRIMEARHQQEEEQEQQSLLDHLRNGFVPLELADTVHMTRGLGDDVRDENHLQLRLTRAQQDALADGLHAARSNAQAAKRRRAGERKELADVAHSQSKLESNLSRILGFNGAGTPVYNSDSLGMDWGHLASQYPPYYRPRDASPFRSVFGAGL